MWKATPMYRRWVNMRQRCNNKNHPQYKHYGGRGIKICSRWDDFKAFEQDMGECPDGFTLERVDNNAGYSPENCIWADWTTQLCNRRNSFLITHNGVTKTKSEWARDVGISNQAMDYRLQKWTVERAVTEKIWDRYQ